MEENCPNGQQPDQLSCKFLKLLSIEGLIMGIFSILYTYCSSGHFSSPFSHCYCSDNNFFIVSCHNYKLICHPNWPILL